MVGRGRPKRVINPEVKTEDYINERCKEILKEFDEDVEDVKIGSIELLNDVDIKKITRRTKRSNLAIQKELLKKFNEMSNNEVINTYNEYVWPLKQLGENDFHKAYTFVKSVYDRITTKQ